VKKPVSKFAFQVHNLRRYSAVGILSGGVVVYLSPMVWQTVVDIANASLTVPLLSFGAFVSLGTGVTMFALAIPQRWYPDELSTIGTAHHYGGFIEPKHMYVQIKTSFLVLTGDLWNQNICTSRSTSFLVLTGD
jgi:hypothetical protein